MCAYCNDLKTIYQIRALDGQLHEHKRDSSRDNNLQTLFVRIRFLFKLEYSPVLRMTTTRFEMRFFFGYKINYFNDLPY